MKNLKTLYVFTNSRKIRHFNAQFTDEFLPKTLSIAEFEKKAIYVPDRFEADPTYLLVLMQQASLSVKQASEKLKIPTEFFAFLKNNSYLFSFFKELAIQKKSIDDLKFSDIYADYEEHLNILGEVFEAYKGLLLDQALYDDIVLPEIYKINEIFIKSFDEIIIELDGFLSNFEWEMMIEISKLTTLKFIFSTSKFNQKLSENICNFFEIDSSTLSPKTRYELNTKNKTLAKISQLSSGNLCQTKGFGLRSLQAAYAMAKVSEFMREGIRADKIAVVLADESFAEILRLYDKNRMFNFAMGESFTHTKFFQILNLIVSVITEKSYVNFDQKSATRYDQFGFKFGEFNVSEELFLKFKNDFDSPCDFVKFKALMEEILALQSDERVFKIVSEIMFDMKNLSRYFGFSLRQICEIFLMRLREQSIDDVGGGEISVIGVLESRGMKFDGVVIIDFNDDLIPKRSINEMFLSSKVREKAGLISYLDRENLQRFYYESLVYEAKKVAICYVQNEEKIASRFLNEFNCISDESYSEASLSKLLMSGDVGLKSSQDELIAKHDFFAYPLSFSRLNTFLTSPRLYYYRYILGVKEPKLLTKQSFSEYGKSLHELLFRYYQKFNQFSLQNFEPMLRSANFSPLEIEILLLKFAQFEKNEQQRYNDGWRVKECEKKVESVDFQSVLITGVIDRIDVRDDKTQIIDYKSGSFDTKSLQLPFYQALLQMQCESFFYDLKSSMSLHECKIDIQVLKDTINNLKKINNTEINFSDYGECKSEAFFILCKGEL